MRKREAKVKAVMELAKAISYLDDLGASLKAGSVTVANGDEGLTLEPGDTVKVEVKATQKPDKESIAIELSWRTSAAAMSDAEFSITPGKPADKDASGSRRRSS